ncbi:hypothetical protein Bxe_A0843 [Paraburkholderia xenovorans LB400]|uniref:Uncharacterized protein n=1 Tax=Paraburkholderia xenovorans (strain LB400) TaxID=266265 RepID=Q13UZ8_PARXL|nr:hypothetical protein Bxe_A0843 [Paraburkholderia xenovorans LB400]
MPRLRPASRLSAAQRRFDLAQRMRVVCGNRPRDQARAAARRPGCAGDVAAGPRHRPFAHAALAAWRHLHKNHMDGLARPDVPMFQGGALNVLPAIGAALA